MKPNKKKLPILENVEIVDAGAEGQSIARVNEMVVFVSGAVPGDVVDVQLTRKKNRFAEGKAINILKPSAKRTVPHCQHFGVCGGCKWQNMSYEWQLHYKQKQVSDNLTRIGKIELPPILPIIGSKEQYYYRNKLEFSFSNKKWLTVEEIKSGEEIDDRNALGFHIPKMFDKILDIKHCHLQKEPSNKIRLEIKEYAILNNLEFWDAREQKGFLRNMIIRTSSTNEVMLIVIFAFEDKDEREKLLDHLANKFREITSLLYVINTKKNDSVSDLDVNLYKGRDHIFEEMEGLKFKIGGKSFYQTNSEQAYELYKVTRDFAGIKSTDIVYDLYTGTGTIANFVAKHAKHVAGIEYVEDAIHDARYNSSINNITNTDFYAGDIKDVLNDEFVKLHGKPDVIVTDPPRAGMHEYVVKKIAELEPSRIVYVSCNPATQARDLALLDEKYKVTKVQPVDMFPQTHHVENVVLLERR